MIEIAAVAGALALISALGVVLCRTTIYSALCLVLTVAALAVIYLVLNAQFLFAVQLIIYAGAVMVLFVFIIALLSPGAEDRPVADGRFLAALAAGSALTVALVVTAANGITYDSAGVMRGRRVGAALDPFHSFTFAEGDVNRAGNVQTVARQLFTVHLLPFEITSLLLLVAAIGAVYLTRRTPQR